MIWNIEKIDFCHFCGKKATYLWTKFSFIRSYSVMVCDRHRLLAVKYMNSSGFDRELIRRKMLGEKSW